MPRLGGAKVVAVTFDRNPLSVLRPELCPEDLVGVASEAATARRDRDRCDAHARVRPSNWRRLYAEEFVEHVLVGRARARAPSWSAATSASGAAEPGTPELLAELGAATDFAVDESSTTCAAHRVGATRLVDVDPRTARPRATSRRRRSSSDGHRPCGGRSCTALKRGRELGYPTANLASRPRGVRAAPTGCTRGGSSTRDRPTDCDPARGTRPPSGSATTRPSTTSTASGRGVRARRDRSRPLRAHRRGAVRRAPARNVAFDGIEALKVQMADDVERDPRDPAGGSC